MKRWYEWQHRFQKKNSDWYQWTKPVANVQAEFSLVFNEIKNKVMTGKINSWYENVFYRDDWNERTAAGAGLDPKTLYQWVHEHRYKDLMDTAGIIKINDFTMDIDRKVRPVLASKLKLKPDTIKFYVHNEAPGHHFPMHFDRNRWGEFKMEGNTAYNPNYGLFIIFFDDWKDGQAFQMGDRFLSWKAGDVFTWDHESTPHGSCNFGYEDRYTMLVNGEYE